jgi:hypothetical protein
MSEVLRWYTEIWHGVLLFLRWVWSICVVHCRMLVYMNTVL